ncbi:MAG: glycerol kinase GlpK [Myxococcota bacterium]|jgi:glycerol kinase|nr:glycerol kinase GlpK [Myxococcota bacterium]
MSAQGVILCIDQGTTGSTALVLDHALTVLARANTEFPQIYPQPGWVEHDPEAIWKSVEASVAAALDLAGLSGSDVRAIGITNQRETSLFWDRQTGQAVHNAIVWQCRRTTPMCERLRSDGHQASVRAKTGLVLDPYFSGTKAAWVLDNVPGVRARAEGGELAFGTIDTFLVWRLTNGAAHVTDVSNASRTMMLDIGRVAWDDGLLEMLGVPRAVLPEVRGSSENYGETAGLSFLPDGIPVSGIAGDQQAALFGQACFESGDAKSTYGTGAFVLMNTGTEMPVSERGLLTTIAWKLGDEDVVYALEGSVFIAGAAVQWLRDELKIIDAAPEVEALARSVEDTGGVMVVPAFAGLGAPYWDPEARGAVLGLTRGSGRGHLARATLEGIAHQVADVVEAMTDDSGRSLGVLKVDGGAADNDLLMTMQADLLGTDVSRSATLETTGLGAGFLAGLAVGYWQSPREVAERWRERGRFQSTIGSEERTRQRDAWRGAVKRVAS